MNDNVLNDEQKGMPLQKQELKPKEEKQKPKLNQNTITTLLVCSVIVLLCLCLLIPSLIVKNGSKDALDAFTNEYDKYSNEASEKIKDYIYKKVLDKNIVKSKAYVNLGKIQTISDLEVLSLYYEVIEANESDNYLLWERYGATGVYTVNLSTAEYIVYEKFDGSKNIKEVLIYLEEPKLKLNIGDESLEDVILETRKSKILLFTNLDEEVASLKKVQQEDATVKFNEYFYNNVENNDKAKKSAKTTVINLIKMLNPNEDININVEFYQ